MWRALESIGFYIFTRTERRPMAFQPRTDWKPNRLSVHTITGNSLALVSWCTRIILLLLSLKRHRNINLIITTPTPAAQWYDALGVIGVRVNNVFIHANNVRIKLRCCGVFRERDIRIGIRISPLPLWPYTYFSEFIALNVLFWTPMLVMWNMILSC